MTWTRWTLLLGLLAMPMAVAAPPDGPPRLEEKPRPPEEAPATPPAPFPPRGLPLTPPPPPSVKPPLPPVRPAPSNLSPGTPLPTGPSEPNPASAPATPGAAVPSPATGPAPATVTIQVPANATLWFGDQRMTQGGTTRTFRSPPLEPGKTYVYKVKVSWPGGQGQTAYSGEHEVTVRAGQTTVIDFTPLARAPSPVVPQGVSEAGQPTPSPTAPSVPRWKLPNLSDIFRRTSRPAP
jgi:uncharacterized protein (TIGR03000 family)